MLLFVGRIDRIKGTHVLLQALQFIKTPLKVVIVGPAWDLEYVREIEEMSETINRVGLHSVAFMGEMSSTALVPWYQKACILVCPYLYETHSNVVREALACGTPVVSTGSHLMENCSDGIFLAQRNPKDLADIINSLFVISTIFRFSNLDLPQIKKRSLGDYDIQASIPLSRLMRMCHLKDLELRELPLKN